MKLTDAPIDRGRDRDRVEVRNANDACVAHNVLRFSVR